MNTLRILGNFLAASIYFTPLSVPLIAQPSWARTQNFEAEMQQLLQQSERQEQKGQDQQAIETLQQFLFLNLQFYRETGDRSGEAETLNAIGIVYFLSGQPQKALDCFNQALPIFREVGNRLGEANALDNIGVAYAVVAQPQKALNYLNQALPIRREISALVEGEIREAARAKEAETLILVGIVCEVMEQPQKALEYYSQALLISRELGDSQMETDVLSIIEEVHKNLGQKQ